MKDTKALMGALVRMKPKPHEELKKKKEGPPKSRVVPKSSSKKQAAK